MTRVVRVFALSAQLAAIGAFTVVAGSGAACSKFGDSGSDPIDGGGAADTAPPAVDGGGGTGPRRIYMFGGYTLTPQEESRPNAYVSTVGDDGEPGPWMRVKGLDDDRYRGGWLHTGTTLFAFGGTVQGKAAAKDGARGTLGLDLVGDASIWRTTAQMATGRDYPSIFVRGTDVYVTGGQSGTTALGNVERYVPGTDTFFPAGAMPAVAGHTAIVHDTSMYVIGGDRLGGAGRTSAVMKAAFDTDGSVLTFENGGALKAVVAYHAFAVVEPWVYIIGGFGPTDPSHDVMRGTFVNGMLTTEVIAPLPTPGQKGLVESCAVVIDHTIYLIGGRDRTTDPPKGDVYVGKVDNGGVVTWTLAKNSLPEGRAAFGCAVSP